MKTLRFLASAALIAVAVLLMIPAAGLLLCAAGIWPIIPVSPRTRPGGEEQDVLPTPGGPAPPRPMLRPDEVWPSRSSPGVN